MIKIICKCGKQIKVDHKFVGKKGKCPRCKETVIIPGDNENASIQNPEKTTTEVNSGTVLAFCLVGVLSLCFVSFLSLLVGIRKAGIFFSVGVLNSSSFLCSLDKFGIT